MTMTRTLYLDCSTGVSGDMLLAAMSHALEELAGVGQGFDRLRSELNGLGLSGFELEWSRKSVGGIMTNHVDVVQTTDQPLRHLSDLIDIIETSSLSGQARSRTIDALTRLGKAEAKVHGVELESVHFHEIGAVDTVVDIAGTMVLLDLLGVSRVVCSPIDLGSGFIQCAHGRLPVPAPACAELAKELSTFGSDCGMERATPTGLAVVQTIADHCGPQPLGRVLAVGYGSGNRSSEEQPTMVRAFVLQEVAEAITSQDRGNA